MWVMDRLVSRSARSLAVMTGGGQSAKGRGWRRLRGKPRTAALFCRRSPQPSSAVPSRFFP